ncbi:hypothetical protein CEXT_681081 [Caerostris extrusa]|uniref:Uncharacterized protein n=1 Tax=Caerostris extrusa TaxID=172846 RepID=A0AAV4WN59_CAEEX|nr:hypothetical protein CEXT_681081 [Caerostris extrusa]
MHSTKTGMAPVTHDTVFRDTTLMKAIQQKVIESPCCWIMNRLRRQRHLQIHESKNERRGGGGAKRLFKMLSRLLRIMSNVPAGEAPPPVASHRDPETERNFQLRR